ncbi:rSAM-partnered protein [Natronococcus pandeyae]|uniref:RSAM-partnered protein n=1 Tax=Natronococcus pandeyae TaxID=2055836 RepID=A0A8J8Q9S8_9EURY|nr:Htur_1727 family rSAM-partnered candidate RiPP [Natronococcus pandeyae]TYL40679.1 rSAM-partnered protein [Natronococcus pandeyae]
MVEKARRVAVDRDARGNPSSQWEVFVRDEKTEPLRHAGSVAAASATEAHEHASRLFGWYAVDVWLCPAGEVERHSTRGLASTVDDSADETEPDAECGEVRVYEETEGTPEERDS